MNHQLAALGGAALVVLGACTGIEVPQQPVDATRAETVEPTIDPVEPTPPPPPDPAIEAEKRRARLARQDVLVTAVGDIMLGSDYPTSRLPPDDGRSLLADIAHWMSDADVAFGNLEGVLVSGGEPAKQCENPAACYLFRSPPRYAEVLAASGFNLLSLANNHARDFGEEGRQATMSALDAADILHSGAEGDVAEWQIGEVHLAMIAFSPTRGSHNLLDVAYAAEEVRRLDETADIVIVSFHGGAEGPGSEHVPFGEEYYYGERRGNVVRFAHSMIDNGADLVLGHGPHVPRGLELYGDRLIAYSLGNFATWYGISVAGDKGLAPMLRTRIDGNGRFLDGEILSARQVRPGGPTPDATGEARRMIHRLTDSDFAGGGLIFESDGRFRKMATGRRPAL